MRIWLFTLLALILTVAAFAHEDPPRLVAAAATPGLAAWEPLPLLAGQRGWLTVVKPGLTDRNPVLRRRALFTLGCLRLPDTRPLLRRSLKDAEREVRVQAAVALVNLGDASGLEGATVALREGPAWLRLYALEGLWRLDSAAAREALQGSADYLTPFLQGCLKQAVASRPTALQPGQTAAVPTPSSLSDLWLEVCDTFILESDHWWHKGDYEQSVRCQQTALFFDPANVEAFTDVAWLQWSMGRQGEAIRTYHQAISANPRSWEAPDALGRFYLGHHETEAGIVYLQQAAKLGSPAIPRRSLGHALESLGRYEQAARVWNDILKMTPDDPIATRQLQRLKDQDK